MAHLVLRSNGKPLSRLSSFEDYDPGDGSLQAKADVSDVIAMGLRFLEPSEAPKALKLDSTGNVAQIIEGANGSLIVEAQVKDIIEAVDPDRHQFLPIAVLGRSGSPVDGTWFLLNVHVKQASIVDGDSDVEPSFGYQETRARMQLKMFARNVRLNRDALSSDIHLWREDRYGRVLMMSDALKKRFEIERIHPLRTIPAIEV
ncbi:MAG: DUF1629 domain-containing protein [Pseudomonadota bacterium]